MLPSAVVGEMGERIHRDGGLATKDVFGLAFAPEVIRLEAEALDEIFGRPQYSRAEALDFLHVAGFRAACPTCEGLMCLGNCRYMQFKRNPTDFHTFLPGMPPGSKPRNRNCNQSA